MSNRLTVMRMLKKRLTESKTSLQASVYYEEMTNVYGGMWNKKVEDQFRKNMVTDVEQLESLIAYLKSFIYDRAGIIHQDT